MSDPVIPAAQGRLAHFADLSVDTPQMAIDLSTLRENIERSARAARDAGVALRPHAKTHKMPQIAAMQIEAGAVGVQVAKLGEAEVMANAGIDDILVGYPILGAAKLDRLGALTERARISVSIDTLSVAAEIARTAQRRGTTIHLLVELDTGLGRVGVVPGPAAVELAERIAELEGIELAGVLTHEGHAYGATSEEELRALTRDACQRSVETANQIRERGLAAPTVSVGSSGSFRFAIEVDGVTEVRPGTYVFNDRTQLALGAAEADDVAAVVVATVISGPRGGEMVIDAGSKSLTSDRMLITDPPPTFGMAIAADGVAGEVVRLSEEHGVVLFPDPETVPAVGAQVAVALNHICPAINLFEQVAIVDHGRVVDHWVVAARGKLQ